jgi:hypothetical protein
MELCLLHIVQILPLNASFSVRSVLPATAGEKLTILKEAVTK